MEEQHGEVDAGVPAGAAQPGLGEPIAAWRQEEIPASLQQQQTMVPVAEAEPESDQPVHRRSTDDMAGRPGA